MSDFIYAGKCTNLKCMHDTVLVGESVFHWNLVSKHYFNPCSCGCMVAVGEFLLSQDELKARLEVMQVGFVSSQIFLLLLFLFFIYLSLKFVF